VSKSLQGRVTEESLTKEEPVESLDTEDVHVSVSFQNVTHNFKFISFQNHSAFKKLCLEVPQTYRHLTSLLEPTSFFEVKAPDGTLDSFELENGTYEIIKQNERSCYLLKIVITE
jgi:hypothetical protein